VSRWLFRLILAAPALLLVPLPLAAQAPAVSETELLMWKSVAEGDTPAQYGAYLHIFPSGQFAALAKARGGVVAAAPANETIAKAISQHRLFALPAPIAAADAVSGEECSLAAGDVITFKGAPAADETAAQLAVVTAKRGDCQAGTTVDAPVAGLAEMLAGSGQSAAGDTPRPEAPSAERVFWQSIAGTKRAADYQAYLTTYPDGSFAGLAAVRLAEIAAPTVKPADRNSGSPEQAAPQEHWIADPKTGCRVWNPHPEPNESVTWSGACENGLAQGSGVLNWLRNGAPNERFEGNMVAGKSSGHGTYIERNGIRYAGSWRDGYRNGQGALTWPDGKRYEGEWRDSKANGQGVFTWPDGSRYEGGFRDNQQSGNGKITGASGQSEGQWRNGKMNGRGVTLFADGRRYEGTYRDSKFNGQGVLTLVDGGRYEGGWRDGKYNGQGVFTWADGRRYEGEWRDNKAHGQGTFSAPNGEVYSGVWTNGCFSDGTRKANLGVEASACP
jgi:hypothetical protein